MRSSSAISLVNLLDRLRNPASLPKKKREIVASTEGVRMVGTEDPLQAGEQLRELLDRRINLLRRRGVWREAHPSKVWAEFSQAAPSSQRIATLVNSTSQERKCRSPAIT